MKIKTKPNKGFTLVELLASIIVLIAVGSVISGIIASILRGSNKTNTIENIRQSGNYVLSQMSKDIEYALPFDGKNTGLSNIASPTLYDTNCAASLNPTPTPITQYSYITIESANNVITKYNCSGSTSSDSVLKKDGVSLIDLTSISLQSCSLQCVQSKPTDIPIIKISFKIGPINQNKLVENSTPPILFETSVTVKNYQR